MRFAVAVATVAALTGCMSSTPPATHPAPVADVIVRVPFDSAWPRVIAFFANDNVPIATLEKASGLVASQQVKLTQAQMAQWIDVAKMHFGAHMPPVATVNFNVFARPLGDSTAVRVNLAPTCTADVMPLFASTWQTVPVECVSNGKFEAALIAGVKEGK